MLQKKDFKLLIPLCVVGIIFALIFQKIYVKPPEYTSNHILRLPTLSQIPPAPTSLLDCLPPYALIETKYIISEITSNISDKIKIQSVEGNFTSPYCKLEIVTIGGDSHKDHREFINLLINKLTAKIDIKLKENISHLNKYSNLIKQYSKSDPAPESIHTQTMIATLSTEILKQSPQLIASQNHPAPTLKNFKIIKAIVIGVLFGLFLFFFYKSLIFAIK